MEVLGFTLVEPADVVQVWGFRVEGLGVRVQGFGGFRVYPRRPGRSSCPSHTWKGGSTIASEAWPAHDLKTCP